LPRLLEIIAEEKRLIAQGRLVEGQARATVH
jgi:hypothetical protein